VPRLGLQVHYRAGKARLHPFCPLWALISAVDPGFAVDPGDPVSIPK
jgi:hypothetical protein